MPLALRLATRFARWLTPQRLTAQAIALGACLWTLALFDFSTSGVMDRAGNVKFQDFLQFHVGGTLVRLSRISELFDWRTALGMMHQIAPQWKFGLPMVYGPQVALAFSPLSRFSFLTAAIIWVAISVAMYFGCCYLVWKTCPGLAQSRRLFWLLALAYPPLFHFAVRGQISALVLACLTAAYLAFRANRPLLAGFALGSLAFKPQFLVAIPIVFLLARSWKALLGTAVGAGGQLALTWAWCGTAVMRNYATTLANLPRLAAATETLKAHAQMHSLRSFWSLLVPWPDVALGFYVVSAAAVLVLAVRSWRADGPLSLRFSALVLSAVLLNPHLFVYDLLALAPALILVADWMLRNVSLASVPEPDTLLCAAYGAYVLPLFGPLTLITHFQISVLALALLQWELWRALASFRSSPSPALPRSHM